eukprot:s3028_g3.t1
MLSKPDNVKIHYGKKAKEIREKYSHRFIGSRFVLTRKPLEEGAEIDPHDPTTYTVKGRWCLQGHLDPDLHVKAREGKLKSPTLSQLGRMAIMQILSSNNWSLQLGDIRGAFLEAGQLEERFRPLFAHHPPGGIPGLPSDAVIEVCGNIYGQNDAPASWFRTFDTALQEFKWKPSCFDPCLYQLRNSNNQLIGVLGIHVDDCALGGYGPEFEASVSKLKERFPFRKWRIRSGEFCGAMYTQAEDGSISMSMKMSVDKIKPANIPKGKPSDACLEDHQVRVLRAINGSLNWVTSQARPDLAAQTSFSQQSFPHPKLTHLKNVNSIVRRAKQHSDLSLTFKPIPLADLAVCCHSDAAFANVGNHTQAGYIIAFTHRNLNHGKMSAWNPAAWRSYRLTRAVSSTLAAESQAMATASGTVEWMCLLLHEIIHGPFDVRDAKTVLQQHQPILVTDCKSLFDHLLSPSSPTAAEDRRTSIDITIIKESVRTLNAAVRWVPTDRMLADSLTKDAGDPIDLLRACIRNSSYQISPEQDVLQYQAAEKQRRLNIHRTPCEDRSVAMSQLNSAELMTLKSLLHRAQHNVGFQKCEAELSSVARAIELEESLNEEFAVITPTSMTDASKRRLTEEMSAGYSGQSPPQLPVQSRQTVSEDFPKGITSLAMWGATVIEFGKYKGDHLSYDELMETAKTNAPARSYLEWIRSHTSTKSSPQLQDLCAYVKLIDRKSGSDADLTFPGSSVPRKIKAFR